MVIKNRRLIKTIYIPKAITREGMSPGDKILDIGCATGHFLNECDKKGLVTYGIDISPEFIKKAKKNTTAKLHVHDLNNGLKIFRANSFNFITVFDVIEHLDSPINFLKECQRILKPKGKIILTTPNLSSLGHFLTRDKWHGYSDTTHQYLFTPVSLRFTTEQAGLSVTRLETPFHPLPRQLDFLTSKLNLGGQIWLVAQKKK